MASSKIPFQTEPFSSMSELQLTEEELLILTRLKLANEVKPEAPTSKPSVSDRAETVFYLGGAVVCLVLSHFFS